MQVPLQLDLLKCTDPAHLQLLNQNFRRTDRSPKPGSDGAAIKQAWHMDSAFLPRHYTTTPRENYYITLLALSPVREGVAPFCMVPGSLKAALAAGAELPPAEQEAIDGYDCRALLPNRFREMAVQALVDADPEGRQVTMDEGDCLILVRSQTTDPSPLVTFRTSDASLCSVARRTR